MQNTLGVARDERGGRGRTQRLVGNEKEKIKKKEAEKVAKLRKKVSRNSED